jgi:hypothetical protein
MKIDTTIKKATHRRGTAERGSFRLISLFVAWFLRKERLAQDAQLARWLNELDEEGPVERNLVVDFTRQALFDAALPSLKTLLERPLSVAERLYLVDRLNQFIKDKKTSRQPGLS